MMRQFLDVSSGYLTPETWTWLDEQFDEGALRDPGHRMPVNWAEAEPDTVGLSMRLKIPSSTSRGTSRLSSLKPGGVVPNTFCWIATLCRTRTCLSFIRDALKAHNEPTRATQFGVVAFEDTWPFGPGAA